MWMHDAIQTLTTNQVKKQELIINIGIIVKTGSHIVCFFFFLLPFFSCTNSYVQLTIVI